MNNVVNKLINKVGYKYFGKTLREDMMEQILAEDLLRVALYLKQGVNVNGYAKVETNLGRVHSLTPLMLACTRRNFDVVQMLLEHKANPNQKDKIHISPLHYCVKHQLIDILELLLNNGGNPNLKGSDKYSLLVYAVQNVATESIETLKKHGAFVTHMDIKTLDEVDLHIKKMQYHLDREINHILAANRLSPITRTYHETIFKSYNIPIR